MLGAMRRAWPQKPNPKVLGPSFAAAAPLLPTSTTLASMAAIAIRLIGAGPCGVTPEPEPCPGPVLDPGTQQFPGNGGFASGNEPVLERSGDCDELQRDRTAAWEQPERWMRMEERPRQEDLASRAP